MVFLELRRDSRVTTGNSGCLLCWPRQVQSSIRVAKESWGLLSSDCRANRPHLGLCPEANSDRAESFHNWSSNGRWIVFTSRRGDGNFTRLYMAYIDADGNARKAFELPQKNPLAELESIWSYNTPDFTVEKVRISRKSFSDAVVGTIDN